jgi:hypothetical protein
MIERGLEFFHCGWLQNVAHAQPNCPPVRSTN